MIHINRPSLILPWLLLALTGQAKCQCVLGIVEPSCAASDVSICIRMHQDFERRVAAMCGQNQDVAQQVRESLQGLPADVQDLAVRSAIHRRCMARPWLSRLFRPCGGWKNSGWNPMVPVTVKEPSRDTGCAPIGAGSVGGCARER